MKSNSFKRTLTATSIALALSTVGGTAFAAGGNIAGVSATPNAVFANESINLKVNVNQGSYGIDCMLHWAVRSANNTEIKGGNHRAQSAGSMAEYAVSFSMPVPGNYTVEATGGASGNQTVSCGGKMTTQLTIKDKNAISANPGLTVAPRAPAITPPAVVVSANPGLGLTPTILPPADSGAPRVGIAPRSGTLPVAAAVAPVTVNANPGLTVAHTKITSMQVSTNYMQAGGTLTVKVNGTGAESQCPTTVLLGHKGSNSYKVSDKVATGAWPRTSVFQLTDPGQYLVSVLATATAQLTPEERSACGFTYSYEGSGIAGSGTVVEVVEVAK